MKRSIKEKENSKRAAVKPTRNKPFRVNEYGLVLLDDEGQEN